MVPSTLSLFALDKPLAAGLGQSRRHGRHWGGRLLHSLLEVSRSVVRGFEAVSIATAGAA